MLTLALAYELADGTTLLELAPQSSTAGLQA